MTPKEFYKTYIADDNWSPLSETLIIGILSQSPVHVLELGCGTGKHLNRLNQEGICTIGIDISPMNVYKAVHKYNLPCVLIGDEGYLRHFCNVDIVFTCSVLDHVENAGSIIEEFKRIANKAIYLAETIDVPLQGGQYYYKHDYEALGFEKLDYEWKSPDNGCIYNIYKWVKG